MTAMNLNEFNRFLQNNQQFLVQKYDEHFGKESIKVSQVKKDSIVRYIYDVFLFNKYEDDPEMNSKIKKSLDENIDQFLKVQKVDQFDNKIAIKLLGFCVQHNDMFAVHYDLQDRVAGTDSRAVNGEEVETKGSPENQNKKGQDDDNEQLKGGMQRYQQQIKEDGVGSGQDSHLRKNQFNMKNSFMDNSMQFGQDNQFAYGNESDLKRINQKLIKKNAKFYFDFFSKEQMSIGVNNTFDRLGYEGNMMTLGAFMIFSRDVGLICTEINKSTLSKKFKKVAEGKGQIDFDTFYLLLGQLQVIDPSLYYRIKFDEPVTKASLKIRRFAFNTQDQNPRELVKNRVFKSKLSQISRKGTSLDQIKIRKQSERYPEESKIHLKDLQSEMTRGQNPQSLGFLEKVVKREDTDKQWLKDYDIKLPKKPRRVSSNVDMNSTNSQPQTRQEKMLDNMKKRINDLESKQKGQTRKRNVRQLNKDMVFDINPNKFLYVLKH